VRERIPSRAHPCTPTAYSSTHPLFVFTRLYLCFLRSDNQWNQQFVYNNQKGGDLTIRQLHDTNACLDGAAAGPGSYSMRIHTWHCWDKKGTSLPPIAYENQKWVYDEETQWLQVLTPCAYATMRV
jgi:hypothetical protein